MDKMREEFESWFNEIGKLVVLADTLKDGAGNYYFAETRLLWECWQASRQALVVELPPQHSTAYRAYDGVELRYALKEAGIKYKAGSFPFKASGRARASNDTDGFIKVLADASSDEILGVHMIGPRVADLIAEAVVAMEFRASAEDIARISHAHPTYTEAFKEASMAATENRAIHV